MLFSVVLLRVIDAYRGSGGMADAHALGACGENRAGSNPASPTMSIDECLEFSLGF